MNIDKTKTAESAMALLALNMFEDGPAYRAWKGMNWDVLNDLFERGWILDPKGKSRSVVFTEEGRILATQFMEQLLSEAVQHDAAADGAPPRR